MSSGAKRWAVGALRKAVRLAGRGVDDDTRRQLAAAFLDYPLWRLPGHYYSPLPDVTDARRAAEHATSRDADPIGIDLREPAQQALLETLAPLYGDIEFPAQPTPGWRFHHNNNQFPHGDAILLHLLLRHWRPSRIIEVGSGFSTAMMVDTIERCPGPPVELTAIEPYPDRLRSLLGELPPYVTLVQAPVQDVPLERFAALRSGDVLFIDSTHVARTGSDVVHELFEVIPRLAPGVRVHLHDICWPFEYPVEWVEQGRAWNEIYAVRALLMNSDALEIVLFNHMMLTRHREWFTEHMPHCLRVRAGRGHLSGHSLWLVRR